eukprot:1175149-Pyramimonas_sp.AAC.3
MSDCSSSCSSIAVVPSLGWGSVLLATRGPSPALQPGRGPGESRRVGRVASGMRQTNEKGVEKGSSTGGKSRRTSKASSHPENLRSRTASQGPPPRARQNALLELLGVPLDQVAESHGAR